jgi:hypothetical protein
MAELYLHFPHLLLAWCVIKHKDTLSFHGVYSLHERDSVVGIAIGYGLDDRGVGVRVPVWLKIFSSPHRPARLWVPLNLLSNGYRGGCFPRDKAAGT